ncbi:RICIN domain-containing protein [Marinoscillum sp. MHG1-6]|uniref:RICIN domain-containing protein n=1 Tax=Marinoscillum sp. MHG1-6 TaxID=2959627 RepID=UPI00215728A3|nr:RICIN domain-containing protein [Marinoscillum sp. MHG1-6]
MLRKFTFFLLMLCLGMTNLLKAQTASTSDNLVAQPAADRTVPFDITDPGISKTVEFGADLAWANEQAFRRNILFMGLDQIDIVRASFQPTYPLVNGTDLTQEQINDLNYRLYLIDTYVGPNTDLALNCDHPFVDDWYVGFPERWEQLIEVSARAFNDAGHNVITVGAFNEPDYGWGQGSAQDMYDITALLNANPYFNGIRLNGGNTLNCDEAQGWYDFLIPAGITEGNTHQLAGSFDGYASFLQNVRANGHHASLDELHNIGEALVGYEYGMQTGIWWADIDYASGEMVKAFDGQRIGYAEHRPNWTSAAVYRAPDGKIQAFGGTSERQAVTTSFNYISKDRPVFYDGHGPTREFVLEMPGGLPGSYGDGQTNAERIINITWGEDIQPAITDGQYIIVNRNSGLVMGVDGQASLDGANVAQLNYTGANSQKWNVYPVDSRVGGDFSYYKIQPASSNQKYLDLYGYILDDGANIDQWSASGYGNQQWYLEYTEDGWFYIRSRESSKCIAVDGGSAASGANVVQWEPNGSYDQQWRLLPVGAPIEFVAPAAPTNLVATGQSASIKLNWTASPDSDVAGYTVLRAESAGGPYNTIARNVGVTAFVDNTIVSGQTYYYAVRAEDQSLNRSTKSNQVSSTTTGSNTLTAHYTFENSTLDGSENLNHAATYGAPGYVAGQEGEAVSLDGTEDFLQLSTDIANHQEITVAAWVNWAGGSAWQRIFDFGNGEDESMYLTTNNWSGNVEFNIYNTGGANVLTGPSIASNTWTHVAVTLGASETVLYVNGQPVAQSGAVSINPLDIKPVLNYIGRSQWSADALFNGELDDFRVYNYPLTAQEIAALAGSSTGNTPPTVSITSPTDGASFDEGTNLTITADASDADGSVTQVEFFVDGMSIGVDATSPYSVNWTIGTGNFGISAVATDNDANTTSSSGIGVSGNCAGSTLTPYYQINYGAWVIGTDITINEGDVVGFGPQPLTGGSWSWSGCGTSGTSREQFVTLTSSCAATATYTNDCGGVSDVTYNVTVLTAGDPYMAVQSITTGTVGAGKGSKFGSASVVVVDNQNNPVSGATVYGSFSGTWNEAVSGVTDGNGSVYFQTSSSAKGGVTVDFCVDNVTHASLPYEETQNAITCTNGGARGSLGGDEEVLNEMSLYPNPITDVLNIDIPTDNLNAELSIIDIFGRSVMETQLTQSTNKLDLGALKSGIYMVRVKLGDSTRTMRVIKH